MKKYYATQLDADWYDWEAYYNEEEASYDLFTAKSPDFKFNKDLWEGAISMMNDISMDDDAISMDDSYDKEEDQTQDRLQSADDYVRNFMGKDYAELSSDELWKVIAFCKNYYNSAMDDAEAVAEILTMVYKKEFKCGTMHGCCQGDWCEYVCPASMADDYLNYIEAVLFGTGTEYAITTEPTDDPDNADTVSNYTHLYKTEDIRQWAADTVGCEPEEMIVRTIKDSYITKHYNYEEN